MKTSGEFRIYVGTYGKYNNGSLFGKWMDLSDYSDLAGFYSACLKLHKDEPEPELMFQDWENIPDFLISECSLHSETLDYLTTVSTMDKDLCNAFELYCRYISNWPAMSRDLSEQLESFQQSYQGYFGSAGNPAVEFAYQYVDETGLLSDVSPTIQRYFDYEAFARDLFLDGYTELDGHIFLDY